MSKSSFRIRLPEREALQTTVAEFPVTRTGDVAVLARRAKLLGALFSLDLKTRNKLAKAVTESCRWFVAADEKATARFGLCEQDSQVAIEIVISHNLASMPMKTDAGTPKRIQRTPDNDRLESAASALTHFELNGFPDSPAVILRQATASAQNPTQEQIGLWAELLSAKTPEDAVAIAQHGRQNSLSELNIARSHGASPSSAKRAAADQADLETLSLVANRAPVAIFIMDQSGTIQWTNPTFEMQTGYSADEAINSRFDEVAFGPSSSQDSVRNYQQALQNGHEFSKDVLIYRKDGQTTWGEVKLFPVTDEEGRKSRWIGLLGDVIQRRRTEDALRAAKRSAETSSRTKSEFLANMSHEIRTPLNAILGMTELALTTTLNREQRDYLRTVQTSADTLLQLLNDILDVSKIEAGKLEIEEVDFSLPEIIHETLKALAVKAHQKGLELAVRMLTNSPDFLCSDPIRIRQILFNLIGNAIKFTEQGEIVVEIEEQWRTEDEVGLHFSVRDTGIGIPTENLRKIFDSFTQVDSSMARRFGGTGLGLTISSQLVRLMNGKIWVQSQEGEGSTFHFTLQAKLAKAPNPKPAALNANELAGKRVLLVDDNATNRKILDEMLRRWGLQPTLADGAKAALVETEATNKNDRPFDLILLDAMMPEVDGFQLAEQLKQRTDLKRGTVMMLSSADRPNSTARCRELGIDAYLVKPVSASNLLEAILDSLSERRGCGFQAQHASDKLRLETTASGSPKRALQVLVVDDHPANRKLAISILNRRGHVCESAADGDEAVAACSQQDFDVVLMDVQMPVCDGFAATNQIRAREKSAGKHTPIIALTAHALVGDREKCLRVGMDSYLSKPIHAGDLVTLVERITGVSPDESLASLSDPNPAAASKPFDITAALARMGGEQDLLDEHIGFVLADTPELLQQMKVAIEEGKPRELELAAHRLKSLVSSYNHDSAYELTQQLENYGKDNVLERASEPMSQLELILQDFIASLEQHRKNGQRY